MSILSIVLIVIAVIAYAMLSVFACGEYMSSTGRSRLHPLMKVLAIPGMLVLAAVFLGPAAVISWWPRKKKPRRR